MGAGEAGARGEARAREAAEEEWPPALLAAAAAVGIQPSGPARSEIRATRAAAAADGGLPRPRSMPCRGVRADGVRLAWGRSASGRLAFCRRRERWGRPRPRPGAIGAPFSPDAVPARGFGPRCGGGGRGKDEGSRGMRIIFENQVTQQPPGKNKKRPGKFESESGGWIINK